MRRRFIPGVGVDGELLGVSLADDVDARVRFGWVRLNVDDDDPVLKFDSFPTLLPLVSCNCLAGVEFRVRVISTVSFTTVNVLVDPVGTFVVVALVGISDDLLPFSLLISISSSKSSPLSTLVL